MAGHIVHHRHLRFYTVRAMERSVVVAKAVQLFFTHKVSVHAAPRRGQRDASTLNELHQPINLVLVIAQYGSRSLGTLEPLVDLPDALNRPAEIRVTFSDAYHFIYVTRRAFAHGIGRIDETEIIMARRHDVDS